MDWSLVAIHIGVIVLFIAVILYVCMRMDQTPAPRFQVEFVNWNEFLDEPEVTPPTPPSKPETLIPVRQARPRGAATAPLDDTAQTHLQKALDDYYESLQRHSNDGQNVHDSVVIRHLSRKYGTLIRLLGEDAEFQAMLQQLVDLGHPLKEARGMAVQACLVEIHSRLAQTDRSEESRNKIQTVLETISRNYTITSLNGKRIPESWILTLVWRRVVSPDNAAKSVEMWDRLLTSLEQCAVPMTLPMEPILLRAGIRPGYDTVCINGRVANVLSVLTMLDSNPRLSEPELDYAEVRNEAMYLSAHVLKSYMREHPQGAALYVLQADRLTAPQKIEVAQFEEAMRQALDTEIRAKYAEIVAPTQMETLIREAQAGVA
jgi:hypothetical protein